MKGTVASSLAFVLCLGLAAPAAAQRGEPDGGAEQQTAQAGRPERREPAANDLQRLPAPVTAKHVLEAGGRILRYAATAGSLTLREAEGRPLAEIAYVAYVLDEADPLKRPITFVLNGGPGASSAFLNLGAMGPKRLAFGNQGDGPSTPPVLVDNAETWLDFTDLVFIDPVGTGYSRFLQAGEDVRRRMWSVEGDIHALARFVSQYLAEAGRMTSPKVLVGESYGGFRVPKMAQELQTGHGVGVSGLVLISPVLDFALRVDSSVLPLASAARLPALAAAAMEARGQGPVTRERLAEVERYATGEYIADYLRGPRDKAAVARMVDRVTAFSGLDRGVVERLAGRIDTGTFVRELHRDKERVASLYDGAVTGFNPNPTAARSSFDDPLLDANVAPLTSAMVDYLARTLNYRVDARYYVLNREVSGRWNWGGGRSQPEAIGDLRAAMALDPKLRAVVAHGYTDIVTPYLESKLVLDQLPAFGDEGRIRLEVFPGGHMFYTRDASRAGLRDSVRPLYPTHAD
ncbi:peptidase S10 [Chelatococcus sp. SYSU_G07232]|uniref:Peptidase S10 n=1 Tax=Chelatococcus albus TaxID=3047466 RepID=A0ABT7AK04_9HYPH|nr:peptidase S10 [Chelatococcus sp. SYSU_G07232]MDJ1159688.1 peptidase S10 [Chelatococcus sp. SYSU_G07232]